MDQVYSLFSSVNIWLYDGKILSQSNKIMAELDLQKVFSRNGFLYARQKNQDPCIKSQTEYYADDQHHTTG